MSLNHVPETKEWDGHSCMATGCMGIDQGNKVRLRANPKRVGYFTGVTDGVGRRQRLLVGFLDGHEEFVLAASLEKVPQDEPQGPDHLVRKGHYGHVRDLRGAITYRRLTGRIEGLLYSLNTTNTNFYPYQFKPVFQFLESPARGLLIADEVGLGKTIEAGLIWTELCAREDARRLLVICPAMLREKWQKELSLRFGVRAEIADAADLKSHLERARKSPNHEFHLICSMQGTRPRRGWEKPDASRSKSGDLARLLREVEVDDALIDLTVIDEAHYMRNNGTLNNVLARLIRPVTDNLVLMSATPVQIGNRDLFNLLNLIDPDTFRNEFSFKRTLEASEPLNELRELVARDWSLTRDQFVRVLREAQRSPIFSGSEQIDYLLMAPPTAEQLSDPQERSRLAEQVDRINPLAKVVTRTLKRDVHKDRPTREPKAILVKMSEAERTVYDDITNAIRAYCYKNEIAHGFMISQPQRQLASTVSAALRHWLDLGDKQPLLDEEEAEELEDRVGEEGLSSTPPSGFKAQLLHAASSVSNIKTLEANDSKYRELVTALKKYWEANPEKKVVLFSYFKKTLQLLANRLEGDGIRNRVLYGGLDKQEALQDFEDPDGPKILLSSEVASEGIDLQFSSLLINYDLPWNPAKIEQRIGRIDRIGQKSDRILIWNFIYEDTVDARIYDRLHKRLGIFKRSLGSIEAVLGEQISQLTEALFTHDLTPEQEEERIMRAEMAIATENRQLEELEQRATTLIAHQDFIEQKVQASQELGRYIRGEDLYIYVRDFLEQSYPGTRLIDVDSAGSRDIELDLSEDARTDFQHFIAQLGLQRSTAYFRNTQPPILRFDNKVAEDEQLVGRKRGIETVHQRHPLTRFVTAKMKEFHGGPSYTKVSSVELRTSDIAGFSSDRSELVGNWVYLVSRWSISGVRDIEHLEYLLLPLEYGGFQNREDAELVINAATHRGTDWLGAANVVDNDRVADRIEELREEQDARFEQFLEFQKRENRDRIRLRENALQVHYEAQEGGLRERIESARSSNDPNRRKLIPAEEGKLRKLRQKVDDQLAMLRAKANPEGESTEVSAGLLKIV